MVEVVAENYHNIWAKKKKLELESKGEFVSWHPVGKVNRAVGSSVFPEVQTKTLCSSLILLQVVAVTLFWYHMTP